METLRKALTYWPPIAFGIIAAGLVFLLYLALRGTVSDTFVTAAASFALVVVTMYYAHQARQNAKFMEESVEQMEKDRAKPGQILAIAFGIDHVLERLNGNRRRTNVDSPDCYPLPKLYHFDGPAHGGPEARDIAEAYEEFPTDMDEHRVSLREYCHKWDDLRDQISDELKSGDGDDFEAFFEARSESTSSEVANLVAKWALEGSLESDLEGEELAEQFYQEALDIRGEHEAAVTDLRTTLEKLERSQETLDCNLRRVRDQWKDEYEIREFEIEKAKIDEDRVALAPLEVGRPRS